MVVDAQETEPERVNRELLELLGELRIALPGVQVLFAFLLAVPFLFIAPSALHRLNFRTVDKRRIVFASNALTIWGLLALAVAMTGVMLLTSDVLFGSAAAIAVAAASAGVFAFFWLLLPTTMSGER